MHGNVIKIKHIQYLCDKDLNEIPINCVFIAAIILCYVRFHNYEMCHGNKFKIRNNIIYDICI